MPCLLASIAETQTAHNQENNEDDRELMLSIIVIATCGLVVHGGSQAGPKRRGEGRQRAAIEPCLSRSGLEPSGYGCGDWLMLMQIGVARHERTF